MTFFIGGVEVRGGHVEICQVVATDETEAAFAEPAFDEVESTAFHVVVSASRTLPLLHIGRHQGRSVGHVAVVELCLLQINHRLGLIRVCDVFVEEKGAFLGVIIKSDFGMPAEGGSTSAGDGVAASVLLDLGSALRTSLCLHWIQPRHEDFGLISLVHFSSSFFYSLFVWS